MNKPDTLLTVVNFEDKLAALLNRRSEWGDYYISRFGYCTKCRAVTPYESSGGMEGGSNTCLKCGGDFSWDEGGYLTGSKVPQEAQKELKWRNTRAGQLRLFRELLEMTIAEEKLIDRRARGNLGKLVALRRKLPR